MKMILALSLILMVNLHGIECLFDVDLNINTHLDDAANNLLTTLVGNNILDLQMAKNLLKTFKMDGAGLFVDLRSATKYTSNSNITVNETVSAADSFVLGLSELLASAPCTCGSYCYLDTQAKFLQLLFKLALENRVIDEKKAISLGISYNLNVTIAIEGAKGKECVEKLYEFRRDCIDLYGGVADGAQCFFVANVATTWNDSFAWCRSKGAMLAQIHTGSELQKILATFETSSRRFLWLAAQRLDDKVRNDCRLPTGSTYWFDDFNVYNPSFSFANTFARVRHCADPQWLDEPNRRCVMINDVKNYDSFDCYSTQRPLCQLSAPIEEFARVRDICLAETPIEYLPGKNVQDCISLCRERSRWCRSFNFVDYKTCQLFSWSPEDQAKKTKATDSCFHYASVPLL